MIGGVVRYISLYNRGPKHVSQDVLKFQLQQIKPALVLLDILRPMFPNAPGMSSKVI